MGTNILEVDNFDGTWDFRLCKKKMKVVLVEKDLDASIEKKPEFSATITKFQKKKIFKTAHSVLMLHFIDNVLRECDDLETTTEIWARLDDFYLVKSFPNKMYLSKTLLGFKMDTSRIARKP